MSFSPGLCGIRIACIIDHNECHVIFFKILCYTIGVFSDQFHIVLFMSLCHMGRACTNNSVVLLCAEYCAVLEAHVLITVSCRSIHVIVPYVLVTHVLITVSCRYIHVIVPY